MRLPGPLAALACLAAAACPAAAQTPVGIHRYYAVALSPDGSRIASVEADQPAAGGEPSAPRLMIRHVGDGRVTEVAVPCDTPQSCGVLSPVWAPDGRHLAFGVREPGGFRRVIYETDPDGAEMQQLLDFDGTVIALHYGPEGRLAMLGTEGAQKEAGASRAGAAEIGQIGTMMREQRIGVIENGAVRWASPHGLFVYEYDWLSGGAGFVGTAAPGNGDADWWGAKLYRFDAAHPEGVVIHAPSSPQMQMAQPKVSPDGQTVSFIGGLMSDFENPGGDVFVLPLGVPDAAPRNLTAGQHVTATTLGWGCAPGHLIASTIAGADGQFADIDAASGASRVVWSEQAVLNAADTAVSSSCARGTAAAIRESFTQPPEIVIGPPGQFRALTSANAAVPVPFTVESVDWTNDGMPVQGWLITPAPAPAGRLPMITVVHGGPAAAVQPYFFGPGFNRSLLEHGHALFMPNPRGSYGQGEAFTLATARDFGHGDLRDILAGVQKVIATHPVDPQRLGVTGVSYGGFMTMWATTQTPMFKAAVARAGISDWLSYYGVNGIGGWLLPYFGGSVYDDPAVYDRSSPILFVKQAKTPTLLMVGQRDIECPPSQSREFWHALRVMGVPTELYIYPGEGHDYWATATISDAETRAAAWFERYLR
jgi:dipeptidyl aminopeptidase/acylaminoacyl peptidase